MMEKLTVIVGQLVIQLAQVQAEVAARDARIAELQAKLGAQNENA